MCRKSWGVSTSVVRGTEGNLRNVYIIFVDSFGMYIDHVERLGSGRVSMHKSPVASRLDLSAEDLYKILSIKNAITKASNAYIGDIGRL